MIHGGTRLAAEDRSGKACARAALIRSPGVHAYNTTIVWPRRLASIAGALEAAGHDGAVIDVLAPPVQSHLPLEHRLTNGFGHGVDDGRSLPIAPVRAVREREGFEGFLTGG